MTQLAQIFSLCYPTDDVVLKLETWYLYEPHPKQYTVDCVFGSKIITTLSHLTVLPDSRNARTRSHVASLHADLPFITSDYWGRFGKVFSNRSARTRVAACWHEDEVWKCNNLRVSGPRGEATGRSESDNSWLTDSAMSDSWSTLSLLWTADCSNSVTLRSWSPSPSHPLNWSPRATSSPHRSSPLLRLFTSSAGFLIMEAFAYFWGVRVLRRIAGALEDTGSSSSKVIHTTFLLLKSCTLIMVTKWIHNSVWYTDLTFFIVRILKR